MKIGILTLPLEANYGGILQAYALQRVLKELGHDVYTIDWHNRKCYKNIFFQLRGFLNRLYLNFIKNNKDNPILWNPFVSESELDIICTNMKPFISSHINLTRRVYVDELEQIDKLYGFDAYVVGSDQVWAPTYSYNSCLGFVKRKDIKKITYAASSGRITWMDYPKELELSLPLLKDFDGISVREEGLISKLKEKTGLNAFHVLDPTLLLDKQQYQKLFTCNDNQGEYVCTYILDPNSIKNEIADKVAAFKTMPIKAAGIAEPFIKGCDPHKFIQPSIESWLKTYNNANFVITDSFHGTVFSLIFNKPFIVIGNENRGMERFKSLLTKFKLESRLIDDVSGLEEIISSNVDFTTFNDFVKSMRKDSIEFLLRYLTK